MDTRLVIRYYPVDGAYSSAESQSGGFGLSLWLSYGGEYDAVPTMGAPGGSLAYTPDLVDDLGSWTGGWASVVSFDAFGVAEGGYVEREIALLEPDGVTVRPVTRGALPLDVIITGYGSAPRVEAGEYPDDPPAGVVSATTRSTASYAGGVVDYGFYEEGTFVSLGVVWMRGGYFTQKPGAESWSNPALPARTNTLRSEGNLLYLALGANLAPSAAPAFWGGFKSSAEVRNPAEVEPAAEAAPALVLTTSLVAAASGWGGSGFSPYDYGSVTPAEFILGGGTIALDALAWAPYAGNGELFVTLGGVWGLTAITLVVDGTAYAMDVRSNAQGTKGSFALNDAPFVVGQAHAVRIELWGTPLFVEPLPEVSEGTISLSLTSGSDSGWVGYVEGDYGSVSPSTFVVSGVTTRVIAVDWVAGGSYFYVSLDGMWGVTSAVIYVDDVPYPVAGYPAYDYGMDLSVDVGPGTDAPDGTVFSVRIEVAGELRGHP